MNSILFLAAMGQVALADNSVVVLGQQRWYQLVKGDEESFVGTLERIPGTGLNSRNAYTLVMAVDGRNTTREVFIGNDNRLLNAYVNRRVRLTGMAVDLKVDGRMKYEIWPAKLEVLGGGGVGPVVGPVIGPVDTNIIAQTNWNVPIPKVGAIPRPGAGHVQTVVRSQDELLRFLGNDQKAVDGLFRSLGIPQGMAWKRNMIVFASGGVVQGPGHSVEILGVDLIQQVLLVRWQLVKPDVPGVKADLHHPGRVMIVPRYDGPVRFDPMANRLP